MKRFYLIGIVLLLAALSLSGVVSAQEPEVIRVAVGANDPRSIDPQQAIDSRDWTMLNQLFPGVVVPHEETREILPAMAESWEVSEDGTVFTFHLMQNVPWVRYNADTEAVEALMDDAGNPLVVKASDFVFGWTRALDPATGSPAAYMLAPYIAGGVEFNGGTGDASALGLEAVDDFTFRVTAPESVAFTLSIYGIINTRAVPAWALEESGDVWTEPENIATYGPFALKEWVHEASLTFIKNPFWPGSEGIQQPQYDELVLMLVDEVVGLREYEAGGVDVALVPSDQLPRLRADATLSAELSIIPGLCSQVWGFNTQKPPLDNVHIRRAFNYAIDRETLVQSVLGGGEVPAYFFTPPGIAFAPAALEGSADMGIHYNPDLAREELQLGLEELGLASAAELPTVNVQFGTSSVLSATAQALQVMWNDVLGVQVELSQLDNSVYWSSQIEDAGAIHRAGWCPDYNDANNYLRDVMRSDSIYNYGRWNNAEYDQLVDEARIEPDADRRQELYTRAEQILVADDPGIMSLYWPVVVSVTKPTIERTFSTIGAEAYWNWDTAE